MSVVNVSKAAAATRAAAEIRKAVAVGYATLRAGHRRWWNSYYVNGSFLSISDTLLESFCEPQRFLLSPRPAQQCHRQPLLQPHFYTPSFKTRVHWLTPFGWLESELSA